MHQEDAQHERRLRARVLAGDEQAWRAWYDATADDLYCYVLWRCGGLRDHADEVTQDAWLVAVRRLPDFDPSAGPFLAWLRGVAAHLLRNRFRKEARRGDLAPACAGRPGTAEPADLAAQRRERSERLARALAQLPAHHEEALRAHYLDGLSVPELAARRGESVKATESLLVRARAAFRSTFPDFE